jgi:KDO2-lipid IV(A) lauroyltransferase
MLNFSLFIIYKIFKYIVLLLPKTIVKFFLDLLSHFIYLIDIKHKKIAMANLDLVYNNTISKNEKVTIVKKSYKNLVYNLYEFIENQTLTLKGFENKIVVKNDNIILNAIKNKRKIILITAHYGNWEYGNTYIPLKYGATTMVGRPMNNKYLNQELNKTRTKNNTQMLEKRDAGKGLIKAIKNNRILGLVIDQHSSTGGMDVKFLGHTVVQSDSSSKLALKFDAVIIPLFFTMKSFGKYEAHFYDEIDSRDFQEKENNILELTQVQADIMSKHIKNNPTQWFWQHRRFKKYHNFIY